ncbi:MAG TPA: energy transducer TonB [Paucimonas sp.]|nr:energy transducer TonB [Paucimonas sp.]
MSAVLPYQKEVDLGGARPKAEWLRTSRFGTLAPIVLLHVGFFYALENGMAQQAAKIPEAVFATLIRGEPARPARLPEPAKSVQLPKLTVPTIVPAAAPDITVPVMTTTATPQEPPPIAPSATSAAPAPAVPKPVSGVQYLQPPQADYPPLSRRLGEQGKVLLRVLVNEKGRAERVELQRSSGHPRLDDAARAAVMRALFNPYIEDGRAIPVYVVVPVDFALD